MTAREMFERLGYTYKENKSNFSYERFVTEKVYFDSEYKSVTVCDEDYEYGQMSASIDTATFKAIQKQLEELGWI